MTRNPKTLLGVVLALKQSALARMWADFNRWQWPRDLPTVFKPHWWDGGVVGTRETGHRKVGFVDPLMDYAIAVVDDDLIQREWMAAQPATRRTRSTKAKTPTRRARKP